MLEKTAKISFHLFSLLLTFFNLFYNKFKNKEGNNFAAFLELKSIFLLFS